MQSAYQDRQWRTAFVLAGTFFYVIGATLGDGIMAIPVELSTTGVYWLLLIMIIPFITEVVAGILFVQLLQKVRKYIEDTEFSRSYQNKGYRSLKEESDEDDDEGEYKRMVEEDKELEEEEEEDEGEENRTFDPRRIQPDGYTSSSTTQHPQQLREGEKEEGELEEGGEEVNIGVPEKVPLLTTEEREELRLLELRNRRRREEESGVVGRGGVLGSAELVPKTFLTRGVDLHTIARFYFNRYYLTIIDIVMLLKLIPGLYTIGLSQTLATIFTSDVDVVSKFTKIFSPIVTIIGFVFVYLLGFVIDHVVSYSSCFKSCLLVLVVVFGLFVFQSFEVESNLAYFSRVYFAETFLIEGSVFVIPTMFSKLKPTKTRVICFQAAVVGGLVFSQVLPFVWSLCVWGVVPQNENLAPEEDQDVNLENSLENGELSNMPFTILVRRNYPNMAWIAYIVEFFVLIMFTVSFLIYTVILKSVLDGLIKQAGDFVGSLVGSGELIRMGKMRKIRNCFSYGQILLFSSFAIINAILAFLLAEDQFLLVEIASSASVLSYIMYLTALTIVEICCNPYKRVRIWCEIPRFLFAMLSILLGVYYFLYILWFSIYYIVKYVYSQRDEEIPF